MEGRAIARPNAMSTITDTIIADALQWRAGQLPGQTGAVHFVPVHRPPTFNGGPGNCPAKLVTPPRDGSVGSSSFNGGPGNCPAKRDEVGVGPERVCRPSMEGRAIARPNQHRRGQA